MLAPHAQPELPPESLARLLEVTRKLATPFDLNTMLCEVVEAGRSVLDAEDGALWLYDPAAREFELEVPSQTPPVRIPKGKGLVGECAQVRRVLNIADCQADPRFSEAVDRATGHRCHGMLVVPLIGHDEEIVGVMQLLDETPGAFGARHEAIATALAAQCAVALQRVRMTEALLARQHLEEEVNLARRIQIGTFDLVVLGAELFMLMGDATGHGFGPALSATQMQAMLRVAFRLGADLDTAFTQVNNQLAEDLPDDRFITAFMGFLDPATHEVRYHSAGQGPILHYRASSRRCDWHKPTSFPLGAMGLAATDTAQRLQLDPGDILALVSDGIYEFANRDGAQFGEGGVAAVMDECRSAPMAELAQRLIDAAFAFGGEIQQADDITLVLVRRLP